MSSNVEGYGSEEQHNTGVTGDRGFSPLRNAEAFQSYCTDVQERLAAHAANRMYFLQNAHDKLKGLLQAARDVEDGTLSAELALHCAASRELLDSVRTTGPTPPPAHYGNSPAATASFNQSNYSHPEPVRQVVHAPSAPFSSAQSQITPTLQGRPNPTPIPIVPPVSQLSRRAETIAAAPPPSISPDVDASATAAAGPRLPRRPMRPLIDIETDAVGLRQDLKDFVKRNPLTSEQGELNIPNCLRLRSIACRHRRLEEECGDSEVAEVTELSEDIMDVLDNANDQEYTVALDDEIDPRPTAYQWGELAERYIEMARAQDGFEWWQRNRNLLAVSDVQPLAEAVAAVQQRFNRLLFRIGARDPFQQQLFDDLRTWAREDQCYLYSLRPKVPMAELMEKAATLEDAWTRARAPVIDEERKQRLVDSVITLLAEPDFGEHGAHDEEVLKETLWECKSHRVPANDKRLRDAVAPWTSFIEGDERFKDLLREVVIEWETQQQEGELAAKADVASPDPPMPDLNAVREVTGGKKIVILGGVKTETLAQRLQAALGAEELIWPDAKPTNTLADFEDDIVRADIVVLASRYSRREWRNSYDRCVREGKKYAQLASVTDPTQVVRHLIKQLCPPVTSRKK